MSSILDIIQSVIIAGIIAIMVLGVHMMTTRSASENQVFQQMQGTADATLAVLQDEIRYVNNFLSDRVTISSNTLYFRNTQGRYVLLEAAENGLKAIEVARITPPFHSDNTTGGSFGENSLNVPEFPSSVLEENRYYLLEVYADVDSYAQYKLIDYYDNGTLYIRGRWDTKPDDSSVTIYYNVYDTNTVRDQTYNINIVDRSAEDRYVFNIVSLEEDGSDKVLTGSTIHPKDIDAVKVDIAIRSTDDQHFQDSEQRFVLDLQKHYYLRGYRLPSATME